MYHELGSNVEDVSGRKTHTFERVRPIEPDVGGCRAGAGL